MISGQPYNNLYWQDALDFTSEFQMKVTSASHAGVGHNLMLHSQLAMQTAARLHCGAAMWAP